MSTVDDLLGLNSPPKGEWKESEFAVYLYTPNKETLKSNETNTRTLGSGFSLSLIGSSISPDREHFLREQIATKMSQGTVYPGNGQVTTLDPELFPPPSQSYYCLVDTGEASQSDSKTSRLFLVCFVSIGKQGLDLFRTELDSFCEDLIPVLGQLPADDVSIAFPGSKSEEMIKLWFYANISYLTRVIQIYHNQLPALLHIAVNSEVEIEGDNTDSIRDINQFLKACSLANLMQFGSNGEVKTEESPPPPAVSTPHSSVQIQLSTEGCVISSEDSSKFCSNWAQVLLAQGTTSPDPFFLRQAVENYKLKIIQDINALKRLLRQAEADYHALYRCYVFLCACGNGKLLLQCAMQEAKAISSTETVSVLQALQMLSTGKKLQKHQVGGKSLGMITIPPTLQFMRDTLRRPQASQP